MKQKNLRTLREATEAQMRAATAPGDPPPAEGTPEELEERLRRTETGIEEEFACGFQTPPPTGEAQIRAASKTPLDKPEEDEQPAAHIPSQGQEKKEADPDGEDLRATTLVVFPAQSERPCFRAYKHPFKVEQAQPEAEAEAGQGDKGEKFWRPGIYYHFIDKQKDEEGNTISVPVDYWFLSWLEVLAIVRTRGGDEHSYLIEYIAHGERTTRRLVLPQSALLGRADEAFKLLRDAGITVINKHLKTARSYLDEQHLSFSAANPERFWYAQKTVGWHSAQSFVLPKEIIGDEIGVCFSGDGKGALYEKNGSFKQWRQLVALYCKGNIYLLFALSSSFSGPLLKWLNIPGGGTHFYSDSSAGKTTALLVGVSSWSSPGFMIDWRATSNGLEGQAACRCDTFIALDDSQHADAKTLYAGIYMLGNGAPKARMNRDASVKEVQSFRIFTLSSGERSTETQISSIAHVDHQAGQAMRLIDVPVRAAYGLFDDLHGHADGKLFSETLANNCLKHHGHAAQIFIKKLITAMQHQLFSLQTRLDGLYQGFGKNLSAQEGRAAKTFSCVALAGELATEWGILPWDKGEAQNAALQIFERWKEAQPNLARSREHAQILKKITDFIERHSTSRFLDINWTAGVDRFGNKEQVPSVRDCAGYYEEDANGERKFLFTGSGLREATNGFDFRRVLQALEDAGAFYDKGTGTEKAKRQRTPDGQNLKLYHLDPAKLEP